MKFIILFLILLNFLKADDNVGIGTDSPDNSSILELESTDKGFLVPRMNTAERNAITNPANGLIVYDTDEELFYYNSGTAGSPNWFPVLSDEIDLTTDVSGILPVANGGLGTGTISGVISGDGNSYSGNTGAVGEIAYWNGANTISGLTELTWDSGNSLLNLNADFETNNLTALAISSEKATLDSLILSPGDEHLPASRGSIYYDNTDDEIKVYDGTDWVAVGGSGGGGTPGGNNGNIQYNNAGSFDGSDNLFWDSANSRLGIGTATPGFSLEVSGTANANILQAGKDGQDGQLVIYSEQGGTDYSVTFSPNAAMTGNADYILPADNGDSDQVLVTDGSGSLSWEDQASGWSLTGNAGTTSSTNKIGTTDDEDVRFITNNQGRIIMTASGNINFLNTVSIRNGNELKIYDNDNSNASVFEQSDISTDINYVLPSLQGNADQVLTNDGSGNLSWEDPPGLPSATNQGETVYYDSTNSEWASTDNIKIYDDAVQINKAVALEPEEISSAVNYTISANDLGKSSYFIIENTNTVDAILLILADGSYFGHLLIIESHADSENPIWIRRQDSNIKIEQLDKISLNANHNIMFIWNGSYWMKLSNSTNF